MTINIHGGGSATITGIKFEQDTNLEDLLSNIEGFTVKKTKKKYKSTVTVAKGKIVNYNEKIIEYDGMPVAELIEKNLIYKNFLRKNGIDETLYVSKKLLPDEAIYVYEKKKVYIIEKKFQKASGSVDEKLQTCDFKKKQYSKLFAPLKITVEYIYILNGDWFNCKQYNDTFKYIKDMKCSYFFDVIPLEDIGLK